MICCCVFRASGAHPAERRPATVHGLSRPRQRGTLWRRYMRRVQGKGGCTVRGARGKDACGVRGHARQGGVRGKGACEVRGRAR